MREPTPPIELTGHDDRFAGTAEPLPEELLARLGSICPTTDDVTVTAEHSRDWWPLAMHWALAGQVPRRAAAVCRPSTTEQVAAILSACHHAHVPVTPAGGRSGVSGGSVPVYGGVMLDTTELRGVEMVDEVSGVVEVWAGTFGPDLEDVLQQHRLTVGHFPQSFDLATVGGWVACRGAGQYSTRYGKIEEMVVGLEVVLADGRVVLTGGAPAAASGPDLTQMILGSEGTLGVITRVWLRCHPLPASQQQAEFVFDTFNSGIEACRTILRRGATPAVLRLYDAAESARSHGRDGNDCVLLVLDEGDPALVEATMTIVADSVTSAGGTAVNDGLVDSWRSHRNDTSALQALTRKGFVVDTMEIAAPWARLAGLFDEVRAAIMSVPTARVATCHLSHSYLDGACLYFTFAATPDAEEVESTYVALWNAGQRAVLSGGGNLSHHHGVGLNRGRFTGEALGAGFLVLEALKHALDPHGILNPGKLGLASPFGAIPWPRADR